MNQLISRSRASAMGLSMISVIMFHQFFVSGCVARVFNTCGHLGVDAFLFVSGFGIYYSLAQSCKQKTTIIDFYRRRLLRIFPTTILGGVAFLYFWMTSNGWLYYPYSPNFVSAFFGLDVWYIRVIVIYYLISPLLFQAIQRTKSCILIWFGMLLVTPVLAEIGDCCVHMLFDKTVYMRQTVVWTIERFPAFFFGMLLAHSNMDVKEYFNWKVLLLCLLCVCMVVVSIVGGVRGIREKYEWGQYFSMYASSFVIVVPLLPVAVVLAGYLTSFNSIVRQIVEWIGRYSLELFLAHSAIFPYCLHEFGKGWGVFIPALLASVVAAVILKKAAAAVVKLFAKSAA